MGVPSVCTNTTGGQEPVCSAQQHVCPGGETEAQRGSATSEPGVYGVGTGLTIVSQVMTWEGARQVGQQEPGVTHGYREDCPLRVLG